MLLAFNKTMVRETRYLWVRNLPESIGEDQICDHFSSYGKIQSVKLILGRDPSEKLSAVVAFMDIKAASKAHDTENIVAGVTVETEYNESSAAVNTSARIQDCSTQRSVPAGTSGQTPGANVQLQPSLHTGRSQQRADGLVEGAAEAKIAEQGESRDSRKTSDRGPTRGGSGVDHDQDRDRSRPRLPYPGSHGSHFSSHRSHLDSHANQGSKLNDSKTQTDSSRSESLGHRSSGRGARSRSRSTGRSQSQGSSESGSQSCEKKLSSVVQLPSTASGAALKNEDQQSDKPRGLLIHGFPAQWTDTSIRDGLVRDYKKYYRGVTVTVNGQGDARYAVVSFKFHEDAAKALEDSEDKWFCGATVTVTTHQGFEIENSENHLCETEHEYSEKATRTVFIGNLDKKTKKDVLRGLFSKYGHIIDIDIKNQRRALSYAFVEYDNITSVVQALRDMYDHPWNQKLRIEFSKPVPSSCVWVDGISDTVSEKHLMNQFLKFGVVMSTHIDRRTGRALVFFETSDHASAAISEMRGKCILERKIQVDFASLECQNFFRENMVTTGQLRPGVQLKETATDHADRGDCTPPFGPPEFISPRSPLDVPQKSFDGHPGDEAVFFGSYERELKEYRGAVGGTADSPRSSRYSSPSRERLDDQFAFTYGDAKNEDSEPSNPVESWKDRSGGGATQHKYQAGYSPANSDSIQISKGRTTKRDSRSTSPVSVKQRFRKERSTSPTSKDYLWNSTSTDELECHMTSRRGSKESLKYYFFSEKPGKAVYDKPPHAGSSSKKSRSSRCDDDSDVMSDRDRSLRGLDQPLLGPKRIIDEPNARRRSVDLPSDLERQRKLEPEIARNLGGYAPSSGSARGEFGAEFGATDSVVKHQLSQKYDEQASGGFTTTDLSMVRWFSSAVAQVSSGSTTPDSKTLFNNSVQDSMGGRNSHGSDDVQTLEKQLLLSSHHEQMATTSGSDVELPEDEAKKEPIVVDDDSDMELENDPESLLRKEYLLKAGDQKNHVAGVHDTDHGKKDGGVKSKDPVKIKSIDTSQSFRKQMEAQKKQGDPDLGSRSSSASPMQSAQPDRLMQMSCCDLLDVVDPYDQQLMISTAVAWPSSASAAATPSSLLSSTVPPLSIVTQTSVIAPPPLWPSAGIPNLPVNNLRPMSLESPAAVRPVQFFHQTSFDGARSATSMTPPYSGGATAMYPQSVLVNSADPRRLSRPDLSNVSPLLSPPSAKRQDSHSSDLDLWATSLKHEPVVTPVANKPKELVSPTVSILKKQLKDEAPMDIEIMNDAAVVSAVSAKQPGVRRKADQAFISEASASKSASLTKIPKISGPTRSDVAAASRTDKDFDEKSQKPAFTSSENKRHVLTPGSTSSGKMPSVESKKPVAAGSVSPKSVPPSMSDEKKPEASVKKLDDSGKSYTKKIAKPSGAKVSADKVEHAKKDGQVKVSSDVAGDMSTEHGGGKDKLRQLFKRKMTKQPSSRKRDTETSRGDGGQGGKADELGQKSKDEESETRATTAGWWRQCWGMGQGHRRRPQKPEKNGNRYN